MRCDKISPRTDVNPKRGDIMIRPLMEILSEIPDFGKAKGKRHPLSAILSMACVAIMCGAMPEVLQNLVLEGKIITTDAMHTQRETCQIIVDDGGDYVTIVKDNQHNLLDDVMATFH